ncbi:MAG: AAA domain-containing protein [Thiobacillus sp.]
MTAKRPRPYINQGIDQLQQTFEAAASDPQVLKAIRHELCFRTVPRAQTLLFRINAILGDMDKQAELLPNLERSVIELAPPTTIPPVDKINPMPAITQEGRQKLINLFSFFKAVEQRRTTLIRTLDERPWKLRFSELPAHESVNLVRPNPAQAFSLTIIRPEISLCPRPPESLGGWLLHGWDDPYKVVSHLENRKEEEPEGKIIEVKFDDAPERVSDLAVWTKERGLWAEMECPARDALTIWERFFALHSQLEREGEALELMLGDGIFDASGVHHPVILSRVELTFTPKAKTFQIVDAEAPAEFYASAFADQPNLPVRQWQQDLIEGELHPLGGEGIDEWLKTVIGAFSEGNFVHEEPQGKVSHPRMGRAPVLFLRKREADRLHFLDTILNDLAECESVTDSLQRIVGCAPSEPELPRDAENGYANEDADVLMTKLANTAQLSILRRLAVRNGVLVQGPPGTGKTHTIANLIGSLLAEGKTVLVTSHTTKALRVLRDQIAEPLRPLCVSVLDSDMAGKRELEGAVTALSARLDDDPKRLDKEADEFDAKRRGLLKSIKATRNDLETAINGEYHSIIADGKEYAPVEVAKIVAKGRGRCDWIPGTVTQDSPSPLSQDELLALYASTERLTTADERDLEKPLPHFDLVWPAQMFEGRVLKLEALAQQNLDFREDYWSSNGSQLDMHATLSRVQRVTEPLSTADNEIWRLAAIQAGMDGIGSTKVWLLICEDIATAKRLADEAVDALYRYSPQFAASSELTAQRAVFEEIIAHFGQGKSLGTLTLLFHSDWKRCIESASVEQGAKPSTLDHFQALLQKIELVRVRHELVARWQQHMVPHGLMPLTGEKPEQFAQQFVSAIQTCLDWHGKQWLPLENELCEHGLDWPRLADESPPLDSPYHRAERLRHVVLDLLPDTVAAEFGRRQRSHLLAELDAYAKSSSLCLDSPVIRSLRDAVDARDKAAYTRHFSRFSELSDLVSVCRSRMDGLSKIRPVATDWASLIERRVAPHDQLCPPGELAEAWQWKQFNQELDRRAKLSVPDLQTTLERLGKDLTDTTIALVERKAWSRLIQRVSQNEAARQALLGWMKTTKKLGAGTGKTAGSHRREAARLMGKARGAVPVWVMPFSRLTANFDPVRDRFDVLIVDEASQEDVVGVAAFYMAEKIIVVGDDEQVTPLDVGGQIQPIQDLIDQWLGGLPDKLFDLKTSVYDRAQIAFGSTIRLQEHFRCVPEIIQFSNWLSYNGAIKPLRESTSTPIKPALVAHRVKGTKEGKKNLVEADAITALIAAAIEHPDYAGKTFGVISLVGDEQAREIETRLRTRLDPTDYEQRRVLCGNPAHFQGDERDVIFLSMVDSKDEGEGPLNKKGDGADALWKKRYNVAASRAKDQLWVVYSLDHATQLKPEDLRRRLIEHAADPGALMRKLEDANQRTESPFEAEVYKLLVTQGYRVKTQWAVGAYRIDMVVEGIDGKRLAIECDGDRWHYDKVAEDLARQALLERLGWRFVRIRGTVFYRNRDEAMKPVFRKLEDMGIQPTGTDITTEPASSTLLIAVKQRAQELHSTWFPVDSAECAEPASEGRTF